MKLLSDRAKWIQTTGNAFLHVLDRIGLIQMVSGKLAINGEILLDGGRIVPLRTCAQHFLRSSDIDLQQLRGSGHTGKHRHAALRCTFGLPVATSGCLQDRVEASKLSPHGRKVHVYARFYQRGGHDAAYLPVSQSAADLIQHSPAMFRNHECGEMITPFLGKGTINLARTCTAVDDAKHLILLRELCAELVRCDASSIPERHTSETGKPLRGIRTELLCRKTRCVLRKQIVQDGLRCGAENGGSTKMRDHLRDRRRAWAQTGYGQHLRFVEDQNTVGDVVQLAAFGGTVRIERFKKLHSGRNNDRSVPVFCCLQLLVLRSMISIRDLIIGVCMMFDHVLIAEDIPKHLGVLFDDRCIGDHIDDPIHAVADRVPERERHGGDRLSAAGWHRKCVQSRFMISSLHAGAKNITALPVQICFRVPPRCNVSLQLFKQNRQRVSVLRLGSPAMHELLGVQIVRVHEAGIQHAREKRIGQSVFPPALPS